jgi:hypothetical protein
MRYFTSEVGSHQRPRCQRQTIAAWLPAFVRVDNASDWLPAREAFHTDLGPMSSAVSGEKLPSDRNRRVIGMTNLHCVNCVTHVSRPILQYVIMGKRISLCILTGL